MSGKNIILIDLVVVIPTFALSIYFGVNVAISLAIAFLAGSCVNVMGALGVFR